MAIETIWTEPIQQAVFRTLLEATARPGKQCGPLPEAAGQPLAMPVLAALVDGAVTLHDQTQSLGRREWGFLQARPAAEDEARFILAEGGAPPRLEPALGSLESPETGATLILQVEALGLGDLELACQGPGIEHQHLLRIKGLDPDWLEARDRWNADFPLGVDIYLLDGLSVCGLPRTTTVRA